MSHRALHPLLTLSLLTLFTHAVSAQEEPVVVELFTSEGCSSCPPADQLLSELGSTQGSWERLIPLAFHVDYWNHLGWQDRFSQPQWTQRQQDYANTLRRSSVYTPEAVLNGRSHCVGSDRRQLLSLIQAARVVEPAARLRLECEHPAGPGRWPVRLRVTMLRTLERPLRLDVAIVERGLMTRVARGENGGRDLIDDFVVRSLTTAFPVSTEIGAVSEGTLTVEVRDGWRHEALEAVALLQDARTFEIYTAARWPDDDAP